MEEQMNITQITPTALAGYCDVATGECIVADSDPEMTHGSATEESSQRPDFLHNEPTVAVPNGSQGPEA
jgi:hypothetical protein